jgi:hypothetical protein
MNERTKNPRESHSFASKWDAIFGNPFMQAPRRSVQPHGVGEQKRCLHAPTPPRCEGIFYHLTLQEVERTPVFPERNLHPFTSLKL